MSRVLHVACPIWINQIGVSTLVKIVKWMGFAISLFIMAGHITVAWDIPSTMSMYNYFKNLEPAISVEKVLFDQFAMGLFLLSNICELICFIFLFYHIRKHHRRHVRLCLPNNPRVAAKKAGKEYDNCYRTLRLMVSRDPSAGCFTTCGDANHGQRWPWHVGFLHSHTKHQSCNISNYARPNVWRAAGAYFLFQLLCKIQEWLYCPPSWSCSCGGTTSSCRNWIATYANTPISHHCSYLRL